MNARARAFTLIELAVVIAIVGLLAVSAIPATQVLDDTRRLSAARELARRLVCARATAMSTGEPAGLRIDLTAQTVLPVAMAPGATTPSTAIAPTGEPEAPIVIPSEFPGVRITAVNSGDGLSGSTTIWFSFEGVPQIRTQSGALTGGFTQDARIEVTGGHFIHIRQESGLVE